MCEFSSDRACLGRLVHQSKQAWGSGIDRFMKSMTKPRNEFSVHSSPGVETLAKLLKTCVVNFAIQRNGLFACATVDITQHVETSRHRGLKADAACRCHTSSRNGWRLWTMIDSRNQSSLKQLSARPRDVLTQYHQPDHLCEARAPDQVLNGSAPKMDSAWFHVDNLCAPPIRYIIINGQITPSSRSVSICT
jgi:hypothetical protein